jgi:hypothetical protein
VASPAACPWCLTLMLVVIRRMYFSDAYRVADCPASTAQTYSLKRVKQGCPLCPVLLLRDAGAVQHAFGEQNTTYRLDVSQVPS